MLRSDIFLKVVVQHGESDSAQRLAEELCKRLERLYGVRLAEVSNVVTQQAPAGEAE